MNIETGNQMKTTFFTAITATSLLIGTSVASAASLQVTGVATGDGSEALFGTDISQAGMNGEILTLDINNFFADDSELGLIPETVTDTVTMTLTAPENYLITSITYVESGTAETTLGGVVAVNGAITVGSTPVNFNREVIGPDSGGEVPWALDPISLALLGGVDSVAVTITNTLFALSVEPLAIARIEKTDAVLTVGLTAIPIPAAAWLFGSGLLGLVGVARRKKAA